MACGFGAWSMVLVTYDTPSRLRDARELATAADAAAVRAAELTEGAGAFAVDQNLDGLTTVYWDTESPRAMSASVSTTELTAAELVAFWDARRAAVVQRPELPGADFESPRLWEIASPWVGRSDADCVRSTGEQAFTEAVEQVACRFPNGVEAQFVLLPDRAELTRFRASFASEESTLPGTQRLGGWLLDSDTDNRGQLAEYVLATNGNSYLYFDQEATFTFALMYHQDMTQDQLKEWWNTTGTS